MEKQKNQEIDQKDIVKEESPKEPQETEAGPSDEPQETSVMVTCKHCKEGVDPYAVENNRWRCPQCNKYISPPIIDKTKENLREAKPSKDRPYELLSSRNMKFSGSEQAQAEMLIQSGVAKDFNDLAKKAFNLIFIKEKLHKAFPNHAMENIETKQEQNASEMIDKSLKQQLLQAQIDNMKKGGQGGTDPTQLVELLKLLDKKDGGDTSGEDKFMDKLFRMQQLKMLSGDSGNQQNQQVADLRKDISELKNQQRIDQVISQASQTQQGHQSSQEMVAKIEKMRLDHDKEIRAKDLEVRNAELNERKRTEEALRAKIDEVEAEAKKAFDGKGTLADVTELTARIKALKEANALIEGKDKTTAEAGFETIEKTLPKIIDFGTEFMKSKQQQQRYQPPPAPLYGPPPQAVELTPEQVAQMQGPPQENPINPGEDAMSPAEQQMSDQNNYVDYASSHQKKQVE